MGTPKKNTTATPIAIIGMAGMFAKSEDLKAYWRLLSRAEDGIDEVPPTHWSTTDFFNEDPKKPDHVYCKRGGFLPNISFDPVEFGIPPASLEATDTSQLLGLVAAKRALRDAGYHEQKDFDRNRASVIIGVTGTQELVIPLGARLGHPIWRKALEAEGVDAQTTTAVVRRISEGYVPWQENSFPGLLGNVVAGRICNRLDFGGTNCVVDAACASSMSAINLAILELEAGRSDMVITGGIDALNDIFMHMCFAKTQILSPTGDAKPFSKTADGTVLGEGVGLIVLKRLADAEKDNDRIYAVIKALRSSSDGKSQSIYAPRAEGQEKALRRAYRAAAVDPATVELVEAHGTGTRVGDAVEFSALKKVYTRENNPPGGCAIGSVKSNIGHTKAAAGAAGLIKATLALHNKVLLPTIKADDPDPKLDMDHSPFYLNTASRPWLAPSSHPRRSAVSAFGFGGSNFHMVLEEHRPEKTTVAWDGSIEIVALSGPDTGAIKQQISAFRRKIEKKANTQDASQACAETRNTFDPAAPCRLLMVVDRESDLSGLLTEANSAMEANREKATWQSGNIFFSSQPKSGKLVFLFPGQGSQYIHMSRDLACCFPEVHAAFEAVNGLDIDGSPLGQLIFPRPVGSRKEASRQEENLRRTDAAQPAIGAASFGMLKVLERFNVLPEATAGHSYGELPALFAAGRIDEKTLFGLSADRGRCMAAAGNNDAGESGTMLAVKAPLEEIEKLLATLDTDVILANRNSPNQGVLSGSSKGIKAALKACREQGFRAVKLPVAAAFHSHLVENARQPFEKSLNKADFTESDIPVFANTTGSEYPNAADQARSILGAQLVSPVYFNEEINNLYAAKARTFLEVGPKPVLTGLVRQILRGKKDFKAIAMDPSAGKAFGLKDLATALCRLAAAGHTVDLGQWESHDSDQRKPVMDIPISGANYRNPNADNASDNSSQSASREMAADSSTRQNPPGTTQQAVKAPVRQPVYREAKKVEKTPPAGSTMNVNSKNPQQLTQALKTVQAGMQTLQSLQIKTAETHQKFLETQAQASQALQQMMRATGHLAGFADSSSVEVPDFTEPAFSNPAVANPAVANMEAHAATQPSLQSVPATQTNVDYDQSTPETTVVDSPVPASPAADNSISATLLEVVSQLTGYPAEMLNLGMDIEADLGIDSIKRVEILSTLEEKLPGLPTVTPDMMGDLKTLGQIVDYLTGGPDANPAPDSRIPAQTPAATASEEVEILPTLLTIVSQLTGYPAEMLNPEMDIEADLGIDSIKRVEILSTLEEKLPGLPLIGPDMMGSLKTLGQIVSYLAGAPAPDSAKSSREPAGNTKAPSTETEQKIRQALVETVSQLTGYPQEMLTAEMDIESDLGIDSIKRVEILSTMEDKMPGLPQIGPDLMGSLKTLGQIGDYLTGPTPGGKTEADAPCAAPGAVESPIARPESKLPERGVVVAVKTPAHPGSNLPFPDRKSVWITTAHADLAKALAAEFAARGIPSNLIEPRMIGKIVAGEKTLNTCGGLILTAENADPGLELSQVSTRHAADFQLARTAASDLTAAQNGEKGFFATVTCLDGAFGFLGGKLKNAASGGLAGLAKTAGIEWSNVHCVAFDIDPHWSGYNTIAQSLIAELLTPDTKTPVEIGLTADARYTLSVKAIEPDIGKLNLSAGEVAIVTGGARGVTAAAAIALAGRTRCTTVLIGRSNAPQAEPEWSHTLTDEAALKMAILKNQFGGKASPREVESAYQSIVAGRSILQTITAIEAAGGQAAYFSADVRNPDQIQDIFNTVRKKYGPARALIHGAGVLEDRLITDKTVDQFKNVYHTKVTGLQSLLEAAAGDGLKYLVLFSSVSARVGNQGQADYAMANEVLNKLACAYAADTPDCKVASLNWGPWDGGMVTPGLKKEFQRAGVDLIPMAGGVERLLQEMATLPGTPVETVIGTAFGKEDHPASGVKESVQSESDLALLVKHQVDTERYPVLTSHVLAGRPVVPFALIAEWLGHGALHDNPGLYLHGLDDMRLFSGIKLDTEKKVIRLLAGKTVKTNNNFAVHVQIRNGLHKDGSEFIHSSARAILTDRQVSPPRLNGEADIAIKPYHRKLKDVYAKILFHGNDLQGITRISGYSDQGMIADVSSAPSPANWITDPLRSRWIADPLVLDSAFQLAIIWCYETRGSVSLPSYAASYRQYRNRFPSDGVRAILKVTQVTDKKMTGDFTFVDANDEIIARLSGYEAIMAASLDSAFNSGSQIIA